MRLKDQKWATALQASLNADVLRSFVVCDPQDAAVLRRILRQRKAERTRITVMRSFDDVDTSGSEPAAGLIVAIRLLEVRLCGSAGFGRVVSADMTLARPVRARGAWMGIPSRPVLAADG